MCKRAIYNFGHRIYSTNKILSTPLSLVCERVLIFLQRMCTFHFNNFEKETIAIQRKQTKTNIRIRTHTQCAAKDEYSVSLFSLSRMPSDVKFIAFLLQVFFLLLYLVFSPRFLFSFLFSFLLLSHTRAHQAQQIKFLQQTTNKTLCKCTLQVGMKVSDVRRCAPAIQSASQFARL